MGPRRFDRARGVPEVSPLPVHPPASSPQDSSAAAFRPGLGPSGYAVAAILVAVTAGLHFGFFERHSLWNNEFITLEAIALPYPELIQERLSRNHVPGYFLVLKAWTGLAGLSQTALRLPSALFVFLGCLVVWRTGRHLFGERLGLLALALCGVNQTLIQVGYDARMYAMLFFASAATLHCLIRYFTGGGRLWLAGLAAAGIFGLCNQLLHLTPIALGVAYVLWKRRSLGNRVLPLLTALVSPIALLTPLVLAWASAQDKVGTSEWSSFQGSRAVRMLTIIFIGDHEFLEWEVVRVAGVVLVVIALVLAARISFRAERGGESADEGGGADRRGERFASLLLIWAVLPALAIAIAGVRSTSQLVGSWRYYITAAPAAHLLIALIVGSLWSSGRRRWSVCIGGGMLAVASLQSVGFLVHPGQGVREAVRFVGDRWEKGDVILTSSKKTRAHGFVYYGLLDARPPWRPKGIKNPQEIRNWIRETFPGANRLWAVYFDDDYEDEELYEALIEFPETFRLQGNLFFKGDTAAGLYDLDYASGAPPNP